MTDPHPTDLSQYAETGYAKTVGMITLVCGDAAEAEDAVQEAMAKAWERLERQGSIEFLDRWIARVALNHVKTRFRRRAAERRAVDRLGLPPSAPDAAGVVEELNMRAALQSLPRRQREVVVLRYYLGQSVDEVASTLGISAGTVKNALHRGRSRLRRELTSSGQSTEKGH